MHAAASIELQKQIYTHTYIHIYHTVGQNHDYVGEIKLLYIDIHTRIHTGIHTHFTIQENGRTSIEKVDETLSQTSIHRHGQMHIRTHTYIPTYLPNQPSSIRAVEVGAITLVYLHTDRQIDRQTDRYIHMYQTNYQNREHRCCRSRQKQTSIQKYKYTCRRKVLASLTPNTGASTCRRSTVSDWRDKKGHTIKAWLCSQAAQHQSKQETRTSIKKKTSIKIEDLMLYIP